MPTGSLVSLVGAAGWRCQGVPMGAGSQHFPLPLPAQLHQCVLGGGNVPRGARALLGGRVGCHGRGAGCQLPARVHWGVLRGGRRCQRGARGGWVGVGCQDRQGLPTPCPCGCHTTHPPWGGSLTLPDPWCHPSLPRPAVPDPDDPLPGPALPPRWALPACTRHPARLLLPLPRREWAPTAAPTLPAGAGRRGAGVGGWAWWWVLRGGTGWAGVGV